MIGFAAGDIPRFPINQILLNSRTVIGIELGGWVRRDPAGYHALIGELMELVAAGTLHPVEPLARPARRGTRSCSPTSRPRRRRQGRAHTLTPRRSVLHRPAGRPVLSKRRTVRSTSIVARVTRSRGRLLCVRPRPSTTVVRVRRVGTVRAEVAAAGFAEHTPSGHRGHGGCRCGSGAASGRPAGSVRLRHVFAHDAAWTSSTTAT